METVWTHVEKSSIKFPTKFQTWAMFVKTVIKEELLEWLASLIPVSSFRDRPAVSMLHY